MSEFDKLVERMKEKLKEDFVTRDQLQTTEHEHIVANEENLTNLLSCKCGDPACPFCNVRKKFEKNGLVKGTLTGMLLGKRRK